LFQDFYFSLFFIIIIFFYNHFSYFLAGRPAVSSLTEIVALIKEGLTPRSRKPFCDEALLCIALLAQAVGSHLTPYMKDLIDQMFANGLTDALIKALTDLVKYLPELLSSVQDRLLSTIAAILSRGASVSGSGASLPDAGTQTIGSSNSGEFC
jgi:hypothetical protein